MYIPALSPPHRMADTGKEEFDWHRPFRYFCSLHEPSIPLLRAREQRGGRVAQWSPQQKRETHRLRLSFLCWSNRALRPAEWSKTRRLSTQLSRISIDSEPAQTRTQTQCTMLLLISLLSFYHGGTHRTRIPPLSILFIRSVSHNIPRTNLLMAKQARSGNSATSADLHV